MNIDKDIENIRGFIRSIRTDLEEDAPDNFKLAKSIENVLSEFQGLREFSTETVRSNAELKEKLETWKKIAEKLASVIDSCCDGENTNTDKYIKKYCKFEELQCLRKKEISCKQCIIDWARNEVLKDE